MAFSGMLLHRDAELFLQVAEFMCRIVLHPCVTELVHSTLAAPQAWTVVLLATTGLHLEQYRHPTRDPCLYWREGLSRDPGDARCNIALGKVSGGSVMWTQECLLRHVPVIPECLLRHIWVCPSGERVEAVGRSAGAASAPAGSGHPW